MSRTGKLAATERGARSHKEASARRAEIAGRDRLDAAAGLASVFAHDLNQPLTAIMAYCEAGRSELKRPDFSREKLERNLERSVAQARRASEMIRDLRRSLASRIPQGKATVADLNAVAAGAGELAMDEAAAGGVELSFSLAPRLPGVQAVVTQLEYLVLGLLRNGIAALRNHAGPRQLKISTVASGETVELSVADSGPGIPSERMAQIFRAFHHDPRGLGMGLWSARSIAEQHGGRLVAENGNPNGAVFRLQLPSAR